MDNNLKEESEWRNHPIVIIAGILVVYTAGKSIFALFNM